MTPVIIKLTPHVKTEFWYSQSLTYRKSMCNPTGPFTLSDIWSLSWCMPSPLSADIFTVLKPRAEYSPSIVGMLFSSITSTLFKTRRILEGPTSSCRKISKELSSLILMFLIFSLESTNSKIKSARSSSSNVDYLNQSMNHWWWSTEFKNGSTQIEITSYLIF